MRLSNADKILSIIKIPFTNKYRIYTSVIFCLLIAFIYLSVTPVKYRVYAKIIFNNPGISLDSVIAGVKSKELIQKTIDQLPMAVNYYRVGSLRKEVPPDSLPVKFMLSDWNTDTYQKQLLISPTSSHSYSIEHEDTIEYYELNRPIKQFYAKFTVVRGPLFNPHFGPVILTLNQPMDMFNAYYKNLQLEADEKNRAIDLTLLAADPGKGTIFLNKLLNLYNGGNNVPLSGNVRPAYNDSLKALKQKIASLKEKRDISGTRPIIHQPISSQQLKTLEFIKPYLQKPVKQFVQVPYTDEVENSSLRNDLDRFNKAQVDKQHMIAQSRIDDLAVLNMDHQISALQINILEQVDRLHNEQGIPVKANSILQSDNQQLKIAELKYEQLNKEAKANQAITGNYKLTIVEKPGDRIEEIAPNPIVIYGIALLAALIIPLLFNLFRNLTNTSIARANIFNRQGWLEKIKMLLGSRQID